MSVLDKVTIISGATGGLGTDVSRIFHENGAKVVLIGTRIEEVQELANSLGSERVMPLAVNLVDPDEAQKVVDSTLERFERIDILLNLAGGFSGGKPVSESSVDILDKMLNMNLRTAYNLSRAAIKPMIEQNWGRIVNTASRDALHARPNYSAYAISKAAVLRLTEAMADEVEDHNITVNAILPGTIDTEANRQSMPKADFNKWVKPSTIANALLFVVCDDQAINGAGIPLYGRS